MLIPARIKDAGMYDLGKTQFPPPTSNDSSRDDGNTCRPPSCRQIGHEQAVILCHIAADGQAAEA